MKKYILLIFTLYLFNSPVYSQIGWYSQSPNFNPASVNTIAFADSLNGLVTGNITGRTTDGGNTWNSSGMLFSSVQYLSSNIAIAVYQNDIFKTTNGGINWIFKYHSETGPIAAISFPSLLTGWVSGWQGTLLKTTDGGDSWISQSNAAWTPYPITTVYFVTDAVGWFLIGGVTTGANLFKTTNGGTNWFELFGLGNQYGFRKIYFWDQNTGFLILDGIYKSTNGGVSFIKIMDNIFDVEFINQNIGFATGIGKIYKTTNAGENWAESPASLLNNDYIASVSVFSGTTAWAASRTFGWIFKTTNAGGNWLCITNGTQKDIYSISFPSQLTGYAVSYADYAPILKTTNGGSFWVNIFNGFIKPRSVFFKSSLTGWITGDEGKIYKTTNGGNNWTYQYTGTTSPIIFSYFISESIGWAIRGGSPYGIYKTIDGGQTWNIQFSTTEAINSIHFITETSGWFAGSYIYKTSNGGNNWNKINVNGPFYTIHFADSSTGWSAGDNNKIVKSTDGGNNWITQIPGLNSNFTSSYFYSPNSGYITGTGGVIVKTVNGGENWISLNSGTTNTLRAMSFISPTTGWTAGNGGIILKTTTGGSNLVPSAPVLISPPNNSTNQPPTALLDWDSLATANSYRIQLSVDSLFSSISFDTSGVTRSYLQMRPGILSANGKYFWRVNAVNLVGTSPWSVIWNFRVNPTGVCRNSSEIPKEFKLYTNYPNPFNPATKIRFDIPKNTNVKISVYDVTGRKINQAINEYLKAGIYELLWSADNLASGVYFYRIETESFTDTKRMILVR